MTVYTETELLAIRSSWIQKVHEALEAGEIETVVPDDLP